MKAQKRIAPVPKAAPYLYHKSCCIVSTMFNVIYFYFSTIQNSAHFKSQYAVYTLDFHMDSITTGDATKLLMGYELCVR